MNIKEYTVRAKRWARGWELHIEGVGVTQSRSLATAEREVIDYLRTLDEDDTAAIMVVVIPELSDETQAEVDEARALVSELSVRQSETAARSRMVARKLVSETGLTGDDAARVLGVSPQRISQLLQNA